MLRLFFTVIILIPSVVLSSSAFHNQDDLNEQADLIDERDLAEEKAKEDKRELDNDLMSQLSRMLESPSARDDDDALSHRELQERGSEMEENNTPFKRLLRVLRKFELEDQDWYKHKPKEGNANCALFTDEWSWAKECEHVLAKPDKSYNIPCVEFCEKWVKNLNTAYNDKCPYGNKNAKNWCTKHMDCNKCRPGEYFRAKCCATCVTADPPCQN